MECTHPLTNGKQICIVTNVHNIAKHDAIRDGFYKTTLAVYIVSNRSYMFPHPSGLMSLLLHLYIANVFLSVCIM